MKRPVVTLVLLCAVVGLAGCPIYDHESAGCYQDSDCALNYVCNQHNGDCVPVSNVYCTQPSDCDTTATCTPAGQCMPGDCSFYHGCVAGYRCDSSSGIWGCVPNASGAAGAGGASSDGALAGQGGMAGQGGQSIGASGASDASLAGAAGGG
ncbi:MAG TPA: hypothetical protein VNW92_20160 [Polyangiaceae bacterium]|jgi:hypothetical protein|nr:hypothetical protein [Polyangiaceae bacterium]